MWMKLAALCEADGPSGYENAVSDIAASMLAPFVREVKRDPLGNVLGFLPCGKPGAPLLALDAHLDEIGFMVTGHKDGFAGIIPLCRLDPRVMPSQVVRLLTEPVTRGVVTCLPPHVTDKNDASVPFEELYLDLGLSQSDAERLAPAGTLCVYDSVFTDMGGAVAGKALDDRACFVMFLRALELLKGRELNVDLVVCGTVQEEVGCRGAVAAAFGQAPDMCVAADVTHAHTPDASEDQTFKAGGGPCIGVGPTLASGISGALTETAKTLGIPYQIEVMGGNSGTNAWVYQISRGGIPCGLISLPLKYMHTPNELLLKDDLENGAKLLASYILKAAPPEVL